MAVSGGVDSITALLLLKEEGYEVAAAHMKLWNYAEVGGDAYRDGRCCSLEAINDLQIICGRFSIPFYVLDYSRPFREIVIENFVSEYEAGRTPNPCILCNTELKWSALLKKGMEIGCDYLATGHYAQADFDKSRQRYVIRRGIDKSRDQSYALWGLSQNALARTLLPLGRLLKSEVRDIARRLNLKNAEKGESREICFIADDDYRRFLKEWKEREGGAFSPGDIIDRQGNILGRHQGIPYYTIGQRKGLGIAHSSPLYILEIDRETNRIVVGDNNDLLNNKMAVKDINWISLDNPLDEFHAEVKIRYLHSPAHATIVCQGPDRAEVLFDSPQRAITPGQSAVFYEGDIVLGGGIIENY